MIRLLLSTVLLLTSSWVLAGPQVSVETNRGNFVLELDPGKAPKTVANFLQYVNDGFYNGTIFHRVISNFMIQGGGFTEDFKKKATREPVPNEANNGLKNSSGSIAMARTPDPHSATAQFFINVKDNTFLNYPGQDGWGYTVFGKVIQGMEVVEEIRQVSTGSAGPFGRDVPQDPVIIEKVSVIPNSNN